MIEEYKNAEDRNEEDICWPNNEFNDLFTRILLYLRF